jgi:rhodanese-related sulfurtransferase
LAKSAGLAIGSKTGAIQVDDHMRTSDPDIYAAGDCVECMDRLTGHPCYVPLGSTANKQGRVVAVNICGGDEVFPGVLGSSICKVFDYCVGRTGMTERAAISLGYDVITAMVPGADKAHYMPDSQTLLMKVVADKKTSKLLGIQVTGLGEGAKRIDVAATAITAGITLDQLAHLDLSYAPPYASAMDNLITAANVTRNKRDGYMIGISAESVQRKIQSGEDFVFLDVRSPKEYEQAHLPKSTLIPLGALRKKCSEIPRDKEIVTYCAISLRGYEASLILRAAGFKDVKVLDGGMAMWPYEKVTP